MVATGTATTGVAAVALTGTAGTTGMALVATTGTSLTALEVNAEVAATPASGTPATGTIGFVNPMVGVGPCGEVGRKGGGRMCVRVRQGDRAEGGCGLVREGDVMRKRDSECFATKIGRTAGDPPAT